VLVWLFARSEFRIHRIWISGVKGYKWPRGFFDVCVREYAPYKWSCVFWCPMDLDSIEHHFLLSFRDMLLFHFVIDCPMNEITSVMKQKCVMLISAVLSCVLLPTKLLQTVFIFLG
jgi:hypothetical protein